MLARIGQCRYCVRISLRSKSCAQIRSDCALNMRKKTEHGTLPKVFQRHKICFHSAVLMGGSMIYYDLPGNSLTSQKIFELREIV